MRYAAYGSNLHPARLTARTPSATLLGTARVPGWSLTFHKRSRDGSGKCMIEAGGNGIYVAVYEISQSDKLTLDAIEGLGLGYNEGHLAVPEFGDCVTYVADPAYRDESLDVYDWYRELVLLGAKSHKFPRDYVFCIEAVTTSEDPDPERRRKNWTVVDQVRSNRTLS